MKQSARSEYACLAMLQLAHSYQTGEPVQTARLAEAHGIPPQFLVQILLQLKGAGLVSSTRGASGGYRLQRPPQEITLLEVLDAIEADEPPARCAGKGTALGKALLNRQRQLYEQQRARLAAVTLADLVDEARQAAEPMWYI